MEAKLQQKDLVILTAHNYLLLCYGMSPTSKSSLGELRYSQARVTYSEAKEKRIIKGLNYNRLLFLCWTCVTMTNDH